MQGTYVGTDPGGRVDGVVSHPSCLVMEPHRQLGLDATQLNIHTSTGSIYGHV